MILFCGDIHRDFTNLINKLKDFDITDSHIIVCGDCGFGFTTKHKECKFINYLNEPFKARNNILYLVRGNHDNPYYFNHPISFNHTHIRFVSDYTILNIEDKNILCIGGGTSIDRQMRKGFTTKSFNESLTAQNDYWFNEIIQEPNPYFDFDANINIICSHEAPSIASPHIKNNLTIFAEKDPTLLDTVDRGRKLLTDVYYKLMENNNLVFHWYYGHYHYSNTEFRGTGLNNKIMTKFIMLSINELKEHTLYENYQ